MDWIVKIFLILLLTTSLVYANEVERYLNQIKPSPNAVITTIKIGDVYMLKVVDGDTTYIKNLNTPPPDNIKRNRTRTIYSDENPYPVRESSVVAQEGMNQVNDWKIDTTNLKMKVWNIRKK